jgi:phosphopantetheine adenylyltransferase
LTATALVLQPSTHPRRLIVGITGDELLKNKKYSQFLGSWKQRQDDVVQFLLSILLFSTSKPNIAVEYEPFDTPVPNGKGVRTHLRESNITIECCEIQDPFGPTITDEAVSALVVSAETRSGGQAVNNERAAKGWKELEVLEIDVLDAHDSELGPTKTEDFASKISSTAIRKRLADGVRTSSL